MTELRVLITGLVLLTSQELYVGGGAKQPGAALAIAVSSETNGKYDVEVPMHTARLVINTTDIAKDGGGADLIKGTDTGRIDTSEADKKIILLSGDHISYGEYDPTASPTCQLFTSGVAELTRGAQRQVPSFTSVGAPSALKANAKPNGADFSGVSPAVLAGWMELPKGRVAVRRRQDETLPLAEFRPSRHQQVVAPRVVWRTSTAVNRRACVVIDPFADDDPGNATFDIVVFLKGGKRQLVYDNMADEETGEPQDFASYDFEMFYKVLDAPPAVPPVPYLVGARRARGHTHAEAEGRDINALSGVNCGPARVP